MRHLNKGGHSTNNPRDGYGNDIFDFIIEMEIEKREEEREKILTKMRLKQEEMERKIKEGKIKKYPSQASRMTHNCFKLDIL